MAAVIETNLLIKRYGTRRGIEDVTFSVEEGEVFGLVGASGAGKTTAIRLLVGAIRPTSGRALVLGRESWNCSPEAHRRMAFLDSDPWFAPGDTAREHLEYIAGLRGLPGDAWRGLAERFGLDASGSIRKLRRSDRQKIGLIGAFMGQESLVVLDAPTRWPRSAGAPRVLRRAPISVCRWSERPPVLEGSRGGPVELRSHRDPVGWEACVALQCSRSAGGSHSLGAPDLRGRALPERLRCA